MKSCLIVFFLSTVVMAQEQNSASTSAKTPVQRSPDQVETSADGKSRIRTKKITHPAAKEGLYLIDEEGVYHYKTKKVSKDDNSMFVRFISMSAPSISTHVNGKTITFSDMYNVDQLMGVDFVYEWQPFKNFGKLGVQAGAGFATANGKGYFADGRTDSDGNLVRARESYTFFSIPLSLGGVYRFEYGSKQWFAPFVAAGGIYNGLIEYRNDNKFSTVGTPAAYGAGGVLINLTSMSKTLAFTMDREYGFSQLWISAEYRRIQAFSKDLDITANQIGVGVGADY